MSGCAVISYVDLKDNPPLEQRTYIGVAITALCDHAVGRVRSGMEPLPERGRLAVVYIPPENIQKCDSDEGARVE